MAPATAVRVIAGKRLSRTREAIEELGNIGWKITEYSKGRYEIRRPTVNSHKLPR
ncbi:MAG: replication protein C, IncQ-type [Marinobacterium sp.]